MKKKLGMLVAMFALFNTSALADSFGVRLGYPLGVQYTSGEAFRISGYVNPFFGLGIGIQGDLILGSIKKLANTEGLNLYYGAGANAGYYTYSAFNNLYSYSYLNVGVQGTGWVEYALTPTLSVFVDASVGIDYGVSLGSSGVLTGINYGGIAPYYGGALGLNFKL
jgi:hypothetical protein